MTDTSCSDMPAWQTRLNALLDQGAAQTDPVRLRYLTTLAARLPKVPPEVASILEAKLDTALSNLEQRAQSQTVNASGNSTGPIQTTPSPLAALNQHIQSVHVGHTYDVIHPGQPGKTEMKSVRAFSEVWSKISAETQVEEAFERGPENAGPLNSHMLVLRSLELMRSLSPDYLRRFMAHADSLLWLEQVNQQYALTDSKAPRRTGAAKTERRGTATPKSATGRVNKA